MSTNRIDLFKQMLAADPENAAVWFGLAKEYEKAGLNDELVEALKRYLAVADDEGNAFGMLARAYERADRRSEARAAYEEGIEAAGRHGHPGMADEYRSILATEYED